MVVKSPIVIELSTSPRDGTKFWTKVGGLTVNTAHFSLSLNKITRNGKQINLSRPTFQASLSIFFHYRKLLFQLIKCYFSHHVRSKFGHVLERGWRRTTGRFSAIKGGVAVWSSDEFWGRFIWRWSCRPVASSPNNNVPPPRPSNDSPKSSQTNVASGSSITQPPSWSPKGT